MILLFDFVYLVTYRSNVELYLNPNQNRNIYCSENVISHVDVSVPVTRFYFFSIPVEFMFDLFPLWVHCALGIMFEE
jgi:hypothetical protein